MHIELAPGSTPRSHEASEMRRNEFATTPGDIQFDAVPKPLVDRMVTAGTNHHESPPMNLPCTHRPSLQDPIRLCFVFRSKAEQRTFEATSEPKTATASNRLRSFRQEAGARHEDKTARTF
jgi:hypothetical protein